MKNDRVPHSALEGGDDDPIFSPIKGANQGIDCPRFKERLIPQSDENPSAAGMDRLKALPNRSTHPPFGIGIDHNFCFLTLKSVFYPFISGTEDDDYLLYFRLQKRFETMF
jgi:hypothetical protein